MKEHIANMFTLSRMNQHVWRVTKRDNPNAVWNFVRREEAVSRCNELNELYATAYVDGHADACSEFSAMLNARPEQEVAYVVQVLGSLLLAWAVLYTVGDKFSAHHALLILALALLWSGYAGLVFTVGKRRKA